MVRRSQNIQQQPTPFRTEQLRSSQGTWHSLPTTYLSAQVCSIHLATKSPLTCSLVLLMLPCQGSKFVFGRRGPHLSYYPTIAPPAATTGTRRSAMSVLSCGYHENETETRDHHHHMHDRVLTLRLATTTPTPETKGKKNNLVVSKSPQCFKDPRMEDRGWLHVPTKPAFTATGPATT